MGKLRRTRRRIKVQRDIAAHRLGCRLRRMTKDDAPWRKRCGVEVDAQATVTVRGVYW